MKAAQISAYGGQDVLAVTADALKPSIDSGQVLVEVRAAGMNPFDWKVREGYLKDAVPMELPATLGGDVAGTVAEIGEDVEGFKVGQAVYGQANALSGQGSFAEYTPVKATQLTAKPESVDFTTAAALPLAASSAYQALVDHIGLQKGQKILVHGGAGGIGSLAIQIAKHIGAYVATTATADGMEFVKGLGADEVIDYKTQDFSEAIKDYDAVFDTVGGETNKKSYTVLKPGGTLVSMVEKPDEELVKKYGITYTSQATASSRKRLEVIAKLVDEGVLKPAVDKVFVLDDAAEALEYLKTESPKGKVVLTVKD
jgi:NADPH:quinone reductase-like Zn-dependent oxidoreductase